MHPFGTCYFDATHIISLRGPRVCRATTQIAGGYGLIPEYDMINRMNDAVALLPGGGPSDIMRVIIGRSIVR